MYAFSRRLSKHHSMFHPVKMGVTPREGSLAPRPPCVNQDALHLAPPPLPRRVVRRIRIDPRQRASADRLQADESAVSPSLASRPLFSDGRITWVRNKPRSEAGRCAKPANAIVLDLVSRLVASGCVVHRRFSRASQDFLSTACLSPIIKMLTQTR